MHSADIHKDAIRGREVPARQYPVKRTVRTFLAMECTVRQFSLKRLTSFASQRRCRSRESKKRPLCKNNKTSGFKRSREEVGELVGPSTWDAKGGIELKEEDVSNWPNGGGDSRKFRLGIRRYFREVELHDAVPMKMVPFCWKRQLLKEVKSPSSQPLQFKVCQPLTEWYSNSKIHTISYISRRRARGRCPMRLFCLL